jgi:hypothetical protein
MDLYYILQYSLFSLFLAPAATAPAPFFRLARALLPSLVLLRALEPGALFLPRLVGLLALLPGRGIFALVVSSTRDPLCLFDILIRMILIL